MSMYYNFLKKFIGWHNGLLDQPLWR